ncbi:hypothetical protein [Streptomyces sp. NPDC058773]|uniref:nSTAND1 domain-containing NTPase n=1 Tax=Streptomyces sp. NPDC058773 TaxID=3346632 RepID=UPI0036AAD680
MNDSVGGKELSESAGGDRQTTRTTVSLPGRAQEPKGELVRADRGGRNASDGGRVGRPENPVDPDAGPVERLAWELRCLRAEAGGPSYRALAKKAHYSVSTLAAATKGDRLPSLEVLLAFAQACGGERAEWEARWRAALQASGECGGAEPAPGCPYPGLAPFGAGDAEVFCGRTELVKELAAGVEQNPLTAVFGASGSGKSSLLRAGLLAGLGPLWHTVTLSPGEHPLAALTRAVNRVIGGQAGDGGMAPEAADGAVAPEAAGDGGMAPEAAGDGGMAPEAADGAVAPEAAGGAVAPEAAGGAVAAEGLAEEPERVELALSTWLSGRPEEERVLLVVDQFEEVFTLCADEAERTVFHSVLAEVAGAQSPRLALVIGVRDDFYGRCFAHPGLRAALSEGVQLPVGPPSRAELREIIVEPAARAGSTVAPELVATVVAEAADQPGALPLVAHALRETWHRGRGPVVRLDDYRATGGMRGAVAQTAEAVYASESPARQALMRAVFLRLITLGDGTEDTRRHVPRSELDGLASPADVDSVLGSLADARLVVLSRGRVEVAHEAVIRAWPRLRRWLEEDREGLRTHRRLTAAATTWDALGRDSGALYRGVQLAAARTWFREHSTALNELEQDFLRSATRHDQRRGRRDRWVTATLAGLLVCALLAMGIAFQQRSDAEQQRQVAVSRQYAAQSGELREQQPEAAALTALKGYQRAHTAAARGSLLSADAAFRANQFTGHTGFVNAVAHSPDGRTIATGSQDRTIKLWDARTHQLRGTLTGHTLGVSSLAFSRDSHTLASGGDDRIVRLWNLRTQRTTAILSGPTNGVSSVAVSGDGHTVAAATGAAVRLWDARSGRVRADLTGHSAYVVAVAFSRDGRTLASAGGDNTVRLWDVATRRTTAVLHGHTDPVNALAFTPDGRTLASGSADRTVRIWDVGARRTSATLTGLRATTLAISPDGRTLATGGADQVRIWDVETRRSAAVIGAHIRGTQALAFSPDSRTLIIPDGADKGGVRLWDTRARRTTATLGGRHDAVRSAAISPDGRVIATAGRTLRLWSAKNPRPLRTLASSIEPTWHLVFSPGGRRLASVETDGTVRLWDVTTAHAVATFPGHTKLFDGAAFSPNGKTLATLSDDRTVRLWDTATHRTKGVLRAKTGGLSAIAYSPDGRTLAATYNGSDYGTRSTVRLWDVARQHPVASFSGRAAALFTVAFSPDGKTLATAGADLPVRLWDVASRRPAGTLEGHSYSIQSLAFSPDGHKLASAGFDNTVRLWDVTQQRTTAVLSGHKDWLEYVGFSPDSSSIVTASQDGSARLWDIDVNRAAADICTLSRTNHWRDLKPELLKQPLCT